MRNFIAFDIGGTLIKYSILKENGNIIYKNEIPTEAYLGGAEVINKVKAIGDELLQAHSISGICLSTAGQVDSKKGEIIYASSLIPEYTGMQIKKELETYFQLQVEVENDVNCVGLAESWIGKGKDAKSLFCLTIGTGIGGSYIIDNQLHSGHSYSGGEIGYIPIEGSQFEELASTRTLIKNVAKRKGITDEEINGKDIFELALKGDNVCIEEINQLVYYLSKGISTIAYMMNPEMIVIGGGITNQKDYLYPLIMKQLEKDLIPALLDKTKIEIAGNLNNAGMVGALRHFLTQESMQPFNRITTMIESNRHKLTKGEATIAKYVTMNLSDVPNHTISQMADKINVSESMITRFCKKLEIGSYNKLRMMAKEATIGTRLHDKAENTAKVEIKENYMNILNKIDTLNQSIDFSEIGSQLRLAKSIILYGAEEMEYVMNQLKYKLMELQIPVAVFSNRYQMDRSFHLLNHDALVVGFSISGFDSNVLDMLEAAEQSNATTIGITSQQDSAITERTDIAFFVPSGNEVGKVTHSITEVSLFYLIDTLLKEVQPLKKTIVKS
ncbi:ROK family protein [Ralstonia pickettii]|nr:ROK family protein [Ralstonia pickettii]